MTKKTSLILFIISLILLQESIAQTIIKSMNYPDGFYGFSADWKLYYTHSGKTLYKHDFESGDVVQKYETPEQITVRDASLDGHFLAIGCNYWWTQVWDVINDKLLLETQIIPSNWYDKTSDAINVILVSDDGEYVEACGVYNREYRCFSLEKQRNIILSHNFFGNKSAYHSFKKPLILLPNGYGIWDLQIPLVEGASGLYFVNLKDEILLQKVDKGISKILRVDGNYALTLAFDGNYQFWDISGGNSWKLLSKFNTPLESRDYRIAKGGQYIFCIREGNGERRPGKVINARDGKVLWQLDDASFKDEAGTIVTGIIFDISEDGTQLFGNDNTGLHIWDITNLNAMAKNATVYQ